MRDDLLIVEPAWKQAKLKMVADLPMECVAKHSVH